MAESESEERIQDLEQRMAAMPGSRIFVGLAEEYRRAGRYEDALNTLKKGLELHPTYLSAQIALARLYQETWRTQEAIEAFLKVLAMDRENLVAAKALSDLYENAKNPVEAIKKLKLYRAISGDKSIDEKIGRMELEIRGDAGPEAAPMAPPAAPAPPVLPVPAPPPAPFSEPTAQINDLAIDPNETVSIAISQYAAPEGSVEGPPSAPAEVSRPSVLTPGPSPHVVAAVGESGERGRGGVSRGEEGEEGSGEGAPKEGLPPSRTLADLYYKQGFLDDARKIYEKLAVANPMDESVTRRLRVIGRPSRRKAARLEHWIGRIRANAGEPRAS